MNSPASRRTAYHDSDETDGADHTDRRENSPRLIRVVDARTSLAV